VNSKHPEANGVLGCVWIREEKGEDLREWI